MRASEDNQVARLGVLLPEHPLHALVVVVSARGHHSLESLLPLRLREWAIALLHHPPALLLTPRRALLLVQLRQLRRLRRQDLRLRR